MTDDMPILSAGLNGGPAGPVEGYTDGYNVGGGFAANVYSSFANSLGVRALSNLTGMVKGQGQPLIPRDKAAAAVKAENLDPAFISEEGISSAALATEMARQTEVKLHEQTTELSRTTTPGRFVSGLIGGAADPFNLALMLLAPMLPAAELGVGGRVAVGAATGAGYNVATEAGINHLSGHDEDTLSWQTVRSAAFGMLVGGTLHGLFGPRPATELPTQDLRNIGNTAIVQASKDSTVNVEPLLDRLSKLELPELERGGPGLPVDAKGLAERVAMTRLNGMDLPTFLETNADRVPANAGQTLRDLQEQARYADTPRAKEKADENLAQFLGTLKLPELQRLGPSAPVSLGDDLRRMAARIPTDLSQAVPVAGSAIRDEPAAAQVNQRIAAAAAAMKPIQAVREFAETNPEVADLQKAMTDAVAEAEHAHAMVTNGTGDFAHVMEADKEANASDGELAKAIAAAVKCGAFKGLE